MTNLASLREKLEARPLTFLLLVPHFYQICPCLLIFGQHWEVVCLVFILFIVISSILISEPFFGEENGRTWNNPIVWSVKLLTYFGLFSEQVLFCCKTFSEISKCYRSIRWPISYSSLWLWLNIPIFILNLEREQNIPPQNVSLM